MGIILAILVFGLIVTIHELGHFLLAKRMESMWRSFLSEWVPACSAK